MQVKMITSQFGLIKNIPRGTILTVRPSGPAYQVLTGEFAGKYVEPRKCMEISPERLLSVHEWNEAEQGYLQIIKQKDEEIDRLKQLVEGLTNGLNKEKDHNAQLEFSLNAASKVLLLIAEKQKVQMETQNG